MSTVVINISVARGLRGGRPNYSRTKGDSSMTIYHMHHVLPKHVGGTDEPSNLVKLTIEEHAQAHKELFDQYGRWQDELAYKGLLKMLGNEEIIRAKQVEGGRKSQKMYPEKPSIGGKALWAKPGMRQRLVQKRIEQSESGNNPMQGKIQKRVCCIFCKKETAVNTLASNHKNCERNFSVSR